MKNLLILIFIFLSLFSFSQEELNTKQLEKFQKGEKVLLEYMYMFAYDTIPFETRVKNIHEFIPRFVALLKEKNSFLYSFDSLLYISKVQAPDNAFKIFTWELKEPLGTHKYYGAIQFNDKNLTMVPLFDFSDTMEHQTQKTLKPKNWYGCIYYNCLLNIDEKGKKQYTLLGLDRADFVSNRKIMEIMTYEDEKNVLFGEKPLLYIYDTLDVLVRNENRLFVEYNDKSTVSLNFNKVKECIVYDNISPPSESEKDAKFTYVPDGTYNGFEWLKNYWKSIYRVYTYSIDKPDSPPVPFPQNNGKRKDQFGQ